MIIESKIQKNVVTIQEDASVQEAAELMAKHYIGSIVVTGYIGFRGLFTERELMMDVIGKGKNPVSTKLADVVAESFVRVSPKDSAEHCLDMMRDHRCRHL
ncbi:MAG TPA: CBS domain-containing protein, partial [Mariprofundaceae bacterium]|nr:CBS domain-containing protein [Mariprofundaceae bacterium]